MSRDEWEKKKSCPYVTRGIIIVAHKRRVIRVRRKRSRRVAPSIPERKYGKIFHARADNVFDVYVITVITWTGRHLHAVVIPPLPLPRCCSGYRVCCVSFCLSHFGSPARYINLTEMPLNANFSECNLCTMHWEPRYFFAHFFSHTCM